MMSRVWQGYADGYSRLMSNQGAVLVKGRRAPVIGRVCMDMCMIDVSGIKNVKAGDEAILFGEELSADEVAHKIGTISYEVVCAIGKRVPRIYVDESTFEKGGTRCQEFSSLSVQDRKY